MPRNRLFVTLGWMLGVYCAVSSCSSFAAPARFWLSLLQTNPYRFSSRDPASAEPEIIEAYALADSAFEIHLWGQPQTLDLANDYDAASNPFRQLQNISFDVVASGAGIELRRGLIHNPDANPSDAGGQRFTHVVDSDHPATIVDQGGQEMTFPRQTATGIERLSGFSVSLPTVDTGIGPSCASGGGVCIAGANGPAWLLGSFEIDAVQTGDFELRLQIGSQAITHVGEQTPETQVILGAEDGIVYDAFANRQDTLVGDSADALIRVVDRLPGDFSDDGVANGLDFLEWQRGGSPVPLSASDLAEWETNFGLAVATLSSLPGDFNDDGHVDGTDFLLWQRGDSPTPLSATDLTIWEENFASTAAISSAAIAVPEPGTLGLAGVVFCIVLCRFRPAKLLQALGLGLAVFASNSIGVRAAQIDVNWLNAADGNWNEAANWDSVDFPNNGVDTFDVTIDATGAPYTVTLNSDVTIDNLALDSTDATLSIGSGRSLVLEETANLLAGTLTLTGGTLSGGTVTQSGGSLQFSSPSQSILNVLDGVTVSGDLTISNNGAKVILSNGTQLQDNTALSANSAQLVADTAITLDNTIDLTGSGSILGVTSDGTLTLSPTAQVNLIGSSAAIRTDVIFSGDGAVINQGTITASGSGIKTIRGDIFDNQGTVEVSDGSTLILTGNSEWTNTGVYRVQSGATLRISGSNSTTASLGAIDNTAGGTVIIADLNNTGDTLVLDTTTGDYSLSGKITGGTIQQDGGARLLFEPHTASVLDGATLEGDVDLTSPDTTSSNTTLRLLNGASFTGNATLVGGGQSFNTLSVISVEQTSTIDNKTIDLGARSRLGVSGTNTLTLGPDAQVNLAGGWISSDLVSTGTGTVVNQGTITVDSGVSEGRINPDIFDNQGTVQITSGGRLTMPVATGWSNSGVYQVDAGATLKLTGSVPSENLGAIDNTAGGTVYIAGTLLNTGQTLVLDATTGDFTMGLSGGNLSAIVGGTIQQDGGARLLFEPHTASVLDGATLEGDVDLTSPDTTSSNTTLRLLNGASFTGNATLVGGGQSFNTLSVISVEQTSTIDNKTIDLGARSRLGVSGTNTLTLGPDAQVNLAGFNSWISSDLVLAGTGTVVNQGIITVGAGIGSVRITPDIFDNQGTVDIADGAHLQLIANNNWISNDASYRVGSGATLQIDGEYAHAGTAQLTGTGTVDINANANTFINAAVIRPGNSPGILTIDGDYTQTSDGLLEIEIGGLTAGTEHDRLVVTGTANLAGRLDVPLIDGFAPAVGDEVVFLTAASVVGGFENYNFPNELPDDVAQQLAFSATDVRVQFVAPIPIDFVSDDAEAEWTTPTDWKENGLDATPDSVNILSVSNNLVTGQSQTVNLVAPAGPTGINAAHSLTVGDTMDEITLSINDTKLSSTTTITITANGVIEQTGDSVLSGQMLDVQGGGRFAGTGTIVGGVEVGMSGPGEAMIEPGIDGVGVLSIVGDFSQGGGGVFAIDITGDNSGVNHDTVEVTGDVIVDGVIKIDVSDLTDQEFTPGDTYRIVETTSSATGDYDQVEVVGRDDIYFEISVGTPSAGGGNLAALAAESTEVVQATGWFRGDGDQDGDIDNIDAQIFAAMLVDNSLGSFDCDGDCFAAANFLDAFDFFDPDTEDGLRSVDFYDIPRFAEALAANSGSLSAAYATIDQAILATSSRASVPEPTSFTLAMLSFAGPITSLHRDRRRRQR